MSRENVRDRAGEHDTDNEQRKREEREGEGKASHLGAELSVAAGTCKRGQDRQPDRSCREDDDGEDAVGGEEAVGDRAAPELTGKHDAHHGCEPRLHRQSGRSERAG